MPHLIGWFVWHILLCYKATTKLQHCFVNGNFTVRCVVCLNFFFIFSRNHYTINMTNWTHSMTNMEHPKYYLKLIARHNLRKEGNFSNLRFFPIVFQLR